VAFNKTRPNESHGHYFSKNAKYGRDDQNHSTYGSFAKKWRFSSINLKGENIQQFLRIVNIGQDRLD
jgi:hypothetical protein